MNKDYINAYKKAKTSMNSVKSSHEIIRELMFQLSNSLEKIIIDIEETVAAVRANAQAAATQLSAESSSGQTAFPQADQGQDGLQENQCKTQ